MATQGYDPNRLLAELFWGPGLRGPNDAEVEIAQRQVAEILRNLPLSGRLVDDFVLRRATFNAPELSSGWVELAQGMLECLRDGFLTESPPPLGIYDHFKGGVYLVTGHALWASGAGELNVEYLSMVHGTKHNRLATQWCEVVAWPDGLFRSRFVYRGSDLNTPEPVFKVPYELSLRRE